VVTKLNILPSSIQRKFNFLIQMASNHRPLIEIVKKLWSLKAVMVL